jgi:diacylglycerol kinase family enzyme
MAGIQQLQELESFEAEMEIEDKVITVTTVAVTVANAAPPTSVLAQGPGGVFFDDGLLDITVVAPMSRVGAIAASYHLLRSALNETATDRDDIGYIRARRVIVRSNPPQEVVLDGEIMGTTPIDVECVPGGLRIFVPPDAAPPAPMEKLEGLPGLKVESKSAAGFD